MPNGSVPSADAARLPGSTVPGVRWEPVVVVAERIGRSARQVRRQAGAGQIEARRTRAGDWEIHVEDNGQPIPSNGVPLDDHGQQGGRPLSLPAVSFGSADVRTNVHPDVRTAEPEWMEFQLVALGGELQDLRQRLAVAERERELLETAYFDRGAELERLRAEVDRWRAALAVLATPSTSTTEPRSPNQ